MIAYPVHDGQEFINHTTRASTSTLASMFFGRRLPRFESTEYDEFYEINRLSAHLGSSFLPTKRKTTRLFERFEQGIPVEDRRFIEEQDEDSPGDRCVKEDDRVVVIAYGL